VRAKDKINILKAEYAKNPNGIPPPSDDDGLLKMSKLNEIVQGLTVNFVVMVFSV
jgi:exonuclease I